MKAWLSNDPSDISGYLVAYMDTRGPNASSTVSTAITGTISSSGTTNSVAMTATSGGAAVKWITAPFESAVTVAGALFGNFWGLESAAAANAGIGFQLFEYTTSEQSVFGAVSAGSEIGITAANQQGGYRAVAAIVDNVTAYTSTVIEAGNRLVIKPFIVNVGTMVAGNTVTMDYNGATAGADGDTFISITEVAYPDQVQFPANGLSPSMTGGPNIVFLKGIREDLNPIVQEIASDDITWGALKNQLEYLEGVETA